MKLTIYTDGGSLNNPGRAACGYLIYDTDNHLIHKEGLFIGIASNNVAEYTGLVTALEKVKFLVKEGIIKDLQSITCIADSQLMVNQMNGIFKIKHADMRDLYMKVKLLEAELHVPISYNHVLREKNADADALVKQALSI